MPTPAQVHVNQPLTNFSLQMLNEMDAFIATKMFPKVIVNNEADLYYKFTAEDMMRNLAKKRGPNTEIALADYGLTTESFFCQEWGIGKDISEREARNSDAILKPEQNAVRFLMELQRISQEVEFITNFFGAAIWDTDLEGGVHGGGKDFTQWSDNTNGDPVEDVDDWKSTMLLATGKKPNKLMVTHDVWKKLKNHDKIIGRLEYNNPGFQASGARVTKQMLAAMLELDEVLVAEAVYNTSAIPGSPANAFISGTKKALLVHVNPNPTPETASAGYHFTWQGANGANEEGIAISIEDVPNKNTRERVESARFQDPKVIAPALGVYAYNVIA